MQHQEFEPPLALKETISCFWYTRRDSGDMESSFEVVPDGFAEIIFYFGTSCSIAVNGVLQPLPSPFLVGLLNQPAIFYSKNGLEIIGVRCFPWTVFDLLGLPSGKDGVRTFEHPIANLQPVLNECISAGNLTGAIAQLIQYFLKSSPKIIADNTLSKAGIAMREAYGTLPVSQVAAAAHATVRTLERKFRQSAGHTVKDVSGLMRFEQVRNKLFQDPSVNLAGLAQELGYADQSHLNREFKRYSGTTPAAFARKAKKAKQTTGNNFVAFVLS